MDTWFFYFEQFFLTHGYAAVCLILLLENMGLPVPGETTLLYTSFLASRGQLQLPALIAIAVLSAIAGDNAGYWLGARGGPWVARVLRLTPKRMEYFRRFFDRYGSWTVFFARFIAGLRIIAGPAAGASAMPWRRFMVANAFGAVVWVVVISLCGFYLGRNWEMLVQWFARVNVVIFVVALGTGFVIARHLRSRVASGKSVG